MRLSTFVVNFTLLVLSIIWIACSHPKPVSEIIDEKIVYFELNENIYFNNVHINSVHPVNRINYFKEFYVKICEKGGYAVIQTYPNEQIFKNYYSDSIQIDFVKAFSTLDVHSLSNSTECLEYNRCWEKSTYMIFYTKTERVILVRCENIMECELMIDSSFQKVATHSNWYAGISSLVAEK